MQFKVNEMYWIWIYLRELWQHNTFKLSNVTNCHMKHISTGCSRQSILSRIRVLLIELCAKPGNETGDWSYFMCIIRRDQFQNAVTVICWNECVNSVLELFKALSNFSSIWACNRILQTLDNDAYEKALQTRYSSKFTFRDLQSNGNDHMINDKPCFMSLLLFKSCIKLPVWIGGNCCQPCIYDHIRDLLYKTPLG